MPRPGRGPPALICVDAAGRSGIGFPEPRRTATAGTEGGSGSIRPRARAGRLGPGQAAPKGIHQMTLCTGGRSLRRRGPPRRPPDPSRRWVRIPTPCLRRRNRPLIAAGAPPASERRRDRIDRRCSRTRSRPAPDSRFSSGRKRRYPGGVGPTSTALSARPKLHGIQSIPARNRRFPGSCSNPSLEQHGSPHGSRKGRAPFLRTPLAAGRIGPGWRYGFL